MSIAAGENAKPRTAPAARRPQSIAAQLDRVRYHVTHQGLVLSLGIGGRLVSRLFSPRQAAPRSAVIAELERRYRALLDRDLANVEQGYYPRELLYQFPVREYLAVMPGFLLDIPLALWRSYRGNFHELPDDVDTTHYPSYYRRTFHWQSDGWLSKRSARFYDAGVELLFGGTADIMRRMTMPAVVDSVGTKAKPRILDIACGTGRFLLQLSRALPAAKLYGLDLSPFYIKKAASVLDSASDVSLITENAEHLPFTDGFFDAVTSIFLFHELPAPVRRTVMREAWRVLKPGGRFAVCDSAQLADSTAIKDVLFAFPAAYHEPYYKGYLRDDLTGVMRECGFAVEDSEPHLVSKVVIGRKRSERRH